MNHVGENNFGNREVDRMSGEINPSRQFDSACRRGMILTDYYSFGGQRSVPTGVRPSRLSQASRQSPNEIILYHPVAETDSVTTPSCHSLLLPPLIARTAEFSTVRYFSLDRLSH